MKNKQAQQTMIDALDIMICHADKGASGFWIDDGEGCGNPAIFPEFEDGLKHGRLVQKEHYLCPWNTAVMYGSGHGNIHTGCYYSCSIKQAQYLSSQELKKVLCRFKDRLENGSYDDLDALTPLLTTREIDLIKKRIRAEQVREEQEEKQQKDDRLKREQSTNLIRLLLRFCLSPYLEKRSAEAAAPITTPSTTNCMTAPVTW